MSIGDLRIARFRREDQAAVRAVILAGLAEHWGFVDPDLNPDLDDIATAYAGGVVLVAWANDEIVGTGILIPRADDAHEVVRMSVAAEHRRRGVATRLLAELVAAAERLGVGRVVLETTASWHEAVGFYTAFGFTFSHHAESNYGTDAHFFLDLPHPPDVGSSSGG